MSNGWTPQRKKRQAELIKCWAPWERSTGPRTAAGKAKSARNADKPNSINRQLHELKQLVRIAKTQHKEVTKLLRMAGLDYSSVPPAE